MPSIFLRPYYYGQFRYPNYLLDATEAIEDNAKLQRDGLKQQRRAAELSRQQQDESLAQQAAGVAELSAGMAEMGDRISEELRNGFSLVVDRMDDQISLFSKAVSELEGIRDVLKTPRATEATELFEHGEYCFQQGFFDDALDTYLKAEQIIKVNYLLQFRIGTLYLEGCNRNCNVIDLPKAEAHLLLAIRYGEADSKQDAKATRYLADAYFRAGKAAYFLGEQSYKNGDQPGMRACLERALGYLDKSLQLWPEHTESIYWQAKCHALLGNAQQTIAQFEVLSDRNRRYYAKAAEDGDFRAVWSQIEAVFQNALQNPGPTARSAEAKLAAADALVAWAKGIDVLSTCMCLGVMEHFVASARQEIHSLQVDFNQLLPRIDKARTEVESILQKTLATRKKELEDFVAARIADRSGLDARVASVEAQMSRTQGSGGMGCLFAFLTYVVLQTAIPILLRPWYRQLSNLHSVSADLLALAAIAGLIFMGFLLGTVLSRGNRNQPLRRQVHETSRTIQEWEQTVAPLVQKARSDLKTVEAWQVELQSRSQHTFLPAE